MFDMQNDMDSNMPKKIGNYVIDREIGGGAFGKVSLAFDIKTGQRYALKTIEKELVHKNPILEEYIIREAGIMRKIDHRNVLKCHHFFLTKNMYCMVLDYCNEGDFLKYIKCQDKGYLEEREAIMYLKQIANGFVQLSKNKIMHRDLKPENLLKHNGELKIGDFGLAKEGVEQTGTVVGTPFTQAYEILFNCSEQYDSKVDLWSIGVVFYFMLYGKYPFHGVSIQKLKEDMSQKLSKEFQFPTEIEVSNDTKKLIRSILQIDPKKRNPYSEKRMENLLKALKDNKVLSTPKKKKEEPKEEGE